MLSDLLATKVDNLIDLLLKWVSKHSPKYYTFHSRPKYSPDFEKSSYPFDYSRLCVIIQGSIRDIEFVRNTVSIYKKNIFPGAYLIVSTWSDEDDVHLESLRELGAYVVVSNKPSNPGISNINLQIVSTSRAVDVASTQNVLHLMKTRTDQRVNAANTYPYLLTLIDQFPASKKYNASRLICLSLNTFKYRLYGVSDQFMFGTLCEMRKYWQPPLDPRVSTFPIKSSLTLREYSKLAICEVYLATKYLESMGHDIVWTLEDSLLAFRDLFCVIDTSSIDLYWDKYTNKEYRWLDYSGSNKFDEITFRDWMVINAPLGKLCLAGEAALDIE